ncbi:hypothetical protein APHAL10511_004856 [Amanita phalloides]|nr:hypothetical protein APHAL10511_004856 [Amanita phalloides]
MSSRNVAVNDTEFERGRGRANDSSSSRESSPIVKRKRALTPASDDDIVLPATAIDSEAPLPPERPLVREPVAFAFVATNVNTYQASLPPSSSSQKKYLPGQRPSTTKAKKQRTKRVMPFSAQTGRFRLQSYDHNSSSQNNAPIQQGQGPYHSLYRANHNVTPTLVDSGPSGSQSPSSSSRPPSKRTRVTTDMNLPSSVFDANLLSMPDPLELASPHRPGGSGQSRLDSTIDRDQLQATQAVESCASSAPDDSNATHQTSDGCNQNSEQTTGSRSSTKRPGFHNRMITILIHDVRSGKVDRQLTEVTVPVKMADNPQDGFWADARDITEKLQSSPSRIDGPARVYTLRGKYRQFFLRVSTDNIDNFVSANIGISADRTLDVVVETPPEIGILPPSPRIPNELLPSSPEAIDTSELSDVDEENRQKGSKIRRHKRRSAQKRQHSSSDDATGPEARAKHSRLKRVSHKKVKGFKSKEMVAMSALDHLPTLKDRNNSTGVRTIFQHSFEQTRGYESPSTDEDPSRLYDMIVRAVEIIIQKQPDGPAYFEWRVGHLPDLIKACGFIQRIMDELVGELAPFRTKTHEIRKTHILAALRLEPKMANDCTEIIKLLKLYGENGTRGYDGRVQEMIARDDPKPYKHLKQLLHLLRNIHEEWKRKHGALQSDTMGE